MFIENIVSRYERRWAVAFLFVFRKIVNNFLYRGGEKNAQE
jgi:hypothetical protein